LARAFRPAVLQSAQSLNIRCGEQVLTLYTTPVVYLYLARLRGLFARDRARAPELSGEVQPAPHR